MNKSLKNEVPKSIAKLMRKMLLARSAVLRRRPPGRLTIQEDSYGSYLLNRTNTKIKYTTCRKTKEGDNNLQKKQTDDQRKVHYNEKTYKDEFLKR